VNVNAPKEYTIVTEGGRVRGYFTEAELEQIRRKFHGYVDVIPCEDWSSLADELHGGIPEGDDDV
jgi:hypothetical protein